MIGKFLISFLLVLAYMFVPSAILMGLRDTLSEDFIIGGVIVLIIGFLPFMLFISKKVFLFPAKNSNPVSRDEIIKAIGEIDIKGGQFDVTFKKNFMVLTPPYLDSQFVSLYSVNKFKLSYYMKLWFDEKSKTVRFKDHLVQTSSVLGIDGFSFSISAQSGYVSSKVYLLDQVNGQLVHFSNSELHKKLIEVVTENGWNLSLKMI